MWMFRNNFLFTNHLILYFGDPRLSDILKHWFGLPPSVPKSSYFTFEEMHGVMLSLPSALGSSFQCFSSSHSWHGLEEAGYRKPAWSSKSKALQFAYEQFYRFSPREIDSKTIGQTFGIILNARLDMQ